MPSQHSLRPCLGRSCTPPALAALFLASLLYAPIHAATPGAPPATAPAAAPFPALRINVSDPFSREKKADCVVQLSFPGENVNARARPAQIKYHGAASMGLPKKSYGLSFDKSIDLPGLRDTSHFILNAACIDRSLMRHKLSYDLFEAMATPDAPRIASRSRFVELQLNDKYEGVYLLLERVDRSLLHLRRPADDDIAHACLYKVIDHAGGFDHLGHGGFEQHEPDPDNGPYWQPLDDINKFVATAPDADFFNPDTGVAARIDIDSAIDFHLLVLFTSNMDGHDKNFYLARDAVRPNTPAPKFFFIPWDYDASFGRNWNAWPVSPHEWLSTRLFDRLLSNPEYKQRYAARWKTLRAGPFAVDRVRAMIDDNARTLGAAAARNAARWESAAGIYPDRLTFEQDIAAMKQWVADRTTWLDKELARRTSK